MSLKNKKSGEEITFKGHLQPLRYKNKMYLGEVATPLGYDNSRKFLLVCVGDIEISCADGFNFEIRFGDRTFSCDHREIEIFRDNKIFTWAIVTRTGGDYAGQ